MFKIYLSTIFTKLGRLTKFFFSNLFAISKNLKIIDKTQIFDAFKFCTRISAFLQKTNFTTKNVDNSVCYSQAAFRISANGD